MTRKEAHSRLKELVDDFFDGLEESEKAELSPATKVQADFQSSEQYSWLSIDEREVSMYYAGVDAMSDMVIAGRDGSLPSHWMVLQFKKSRDELKR